MQKLAWKPVELDGNLLNGDVGGLIGIDECTDYDLSTLCKQNRKRKIKAANDDLPEKRKLKKTKAEKTDKSLVLLNDNSKSKVKLKAGHVHSKTKPIKLKTKVEKVLDMLDFSPSKKGSTQQNITTTPVVCNEKSSSAPVGEELISTELDVEEMNTWSGFGLPKSILKAIKEFGFKEPTPIQAMTLPSAILGRRDILGAAETGSGKTLAFGLPILTGILKCKEKEQISEEQDVSEDLESLSEHDSDNGDDNVQGIGCVKVINGISLDKEVCKSALYGLILTPTRELAIQVKDHLVAVAKYTGIRVAVVLGGMAVEKQQRILSKSPEIVVATPGRLWELIQQGNSHLSQINDIKFLAIDETDRMVERGHFQELHELLERLNADESKRKLRQNFVFSATLTLVHELPRHLAVKKMRFRNKAIAKMTSHQKLRQIIKLLGIINPKVVDVTQKGGTSETLTESCIMCAFHEKDYYVYYFLQRHPGRTLIFCNSIGCVKRLTTLLTLLGCAPMALHASMQQRQRLKNLDCFRDKESSILIATDVAARGLDIPCVEHVLHYQTPRTSESYVHRSGRTARALREGITIVLVEPGELSNYLRLCRTLGKEEDLPHFPVQENILSAVKQRVKLAREVDKLDLQVRKANSERGWIQKASKEMDILIDDDISTKYDVNEARSIKKVSDVKRKQLAELLTKPLVPKGFSGKYPLISAEVNASLEPLTKTDTAVNTLKNSVENLSNMRRKKAKWLFKSKDHGSGQKTENLDIRKKLAKNKKNNNRKRKATQNANLTQAKC